MSAVVHAQSAAAASVRLHAGEIGNVTGGVCGCQSHSADVGGHVCVVSLLAASTSVRSVACPCIYAYHSGHRAGSTHFN